MWKKLAQYIGRYCAKHSIREGWGMLVLLVGFMLAACGPLTSESTDRRLEVLTESSLGQDFFSGHQATIIIFLSPDCPLCENYSLVINLLKNAHTDADIVYYGVFPGKNYTNPEILGYLNQYKPGVIPYLDPDYLLTEMLGATVTPEVFVFDSIGTLQYKGAIDNWIPRLGQKRTVVTERYLSDALNSVLSGEPVVRTYTKAVGCFIE